MASASMLQKLCLANSLKFWLMMLRPIQIGLDGKLEGLAHRPGPGDNLASRLGKLGRKLILQLQEDFEGFFVIWHGFIMTRMRVLSFLIPGGGDGSSQVVGGNDELVGLI